jgi:predicted nucleotide-binding protein
LWLVGGTKRFTNSKDLFRTEVVGKFDDAKSSGDKPVKGGAKEHAMRDILDSEKDLHVSRTIFVGSSHEGLDQAEQICAALRASDTLNGSDGLKSSCDAKFNPKKWTEFFKPGSFNFEALEQMLMECCAAVFVVRRDDLVRPQQASNDPAYMPRGNVLLEFGLVAGRLGRHNIALCRFDNAELPTDLAGMTVIDVVGAVSQDDGSRPMASAPNDQLVNRLADWASHLLATAERVPRTEVFHGYTGRWEFEMHLGRWRGILIKDPSYVTVNGSFDLLISPEGGEGAGYAYGTLAFRLEPDSSDSGHQSYMGSFEIIHEIRNIDCKADGTIEFGSRRLGTHLINAVGEAWPELRDFTHVAEPWTYKWVLHATNRPWELTGMLYSSIPGPVAGEIIARKLRNIS